MLFLSIFLGGFTLGIFIALYIFAPERQEDLWDPQNLPVNALHKQVQTGFPIANNVKINKKQSILISGIKRVKFKKYSSFVIQNPR